MKQLLYIALLAVAFACTQKSNEHDHHESAPGGDPNQVLYDQVMAIHDEVMPKMDDMYKLKQDLQEQLKAGKDLAEEQKNNLSSSIARLDSASESMMDWMHKFSPLPDSVDQEKAREYLENEMERVRKVKDQVNDAIEAAQQLKKP